MINVIIILLLKGRSWGYKTEIHHPVSKSYHYGGPSHGGYHVSQYNMPDYHHHHDDYHHKPKYHYSQPKYHHKEVKIIREPIYIKEYKPSPPPPPPPAPKKEDDMFKMKFEIPMGKIFEDKEEPKEEPKQEPDMYGYKKPAPPPPPKKEKKEIEIKIPKINIDKMFDKEMGGVEGEAGVGEEDRK